MYINREELLKSIQSKKMVDIIPNCNEPKISDALYKQGQAIKEIIKTQPKADYAPVVFCDECKHKEVLVPSTAIWCNKHKIYIKPQPTDFCSYGEKESEVQGE